MPCYASVDSMAGVSWAVENEVGRVAKPGGSARRKHLEYDPVMAWSHASCNAVDVIRQV